MATSAPFPEWSRPLVSLREGSEPQILPRAMESCRLGSQESGSSWVTSSTQPPVTLRAWIFQRQDYEMSRCLVSAVGVWSLWWGDDGLGGSPRDDRELQVSTWVSAPLFTRPAAFSPLPFPPPEEEMVKDYTVAAGTSKAGSGSQR